MSDDEDIRMATESREAQVAFWENRREETRVKMLEARHQFWIKAGSKYSEWRPVRDAYWTALDNYQNAVVELMKARKEVRRVHS